MKALIICGSRRGGFTSHMCTSFSEGLAVHGVSSEIIYPNEMNIGHCTGCGDCSDGECVISDDMNRVIEKFKESDLLALASPIHFSGPSSIIKTVIDRFQPIWFNLSQHPRFVVPLLSGGGPEPYFKNTISTFKAFSITAKMEWLDGLNISNTDVMDMKDVERSAFDLGDRVGAIIVGHDRK